MKPRSHDNPWHGVGEEGKMNGRRRKRSSRTGPRCMHHEERCIFIGKIMCKAIKGRERQETSLVSARVYEVGLFSGAPYTLTSRLTQKTKLKRETQRGNLNRGAYGVSTTKGMTGGKPPSAENCIMQLSTLGRKGEGWRCTTEYK